MGAKLKIPATERARLEARSPKQVVTDRFQSGFASVKFARYNDFAGRYLADRLYDSENEAHDHHVVAYTKDLLCQAVAHATRCTYEALPLNLRHLNDEPRANRESLDLMTALSRAEREINQSTLPLDEKIAAIHALTETVSR